MYTSLKCFPSRIIGTGQNQFWHNILLQRFDENCLYSIFMEDCVTDTSGCDNWEIQDRLLYNFMFGSFVMLVEPGCGLTDRGIEFKSR
jgi:hypothetical protein